MHQIIARILAVLLALQPWATGLALPRSKTVGETSSLSNPNTGLSNPDQPQTAQPRVANQVLGAFSSDGAAPPSLTLRLEPKFSNQHTTSLFDSSIQTGGRLYDRYQRWIE